MRARVATDPQEKSLEICLVHHFDNPCIVRVLLQMIKHQLAPRLSPIQFDRHVPITGLDHKLGKEVCTRHQRIARDVIGEIPKRLVLHRIQEICYRVIDCGQDLRAPTLIMSYRK